MSSSEATRLDRLQTTRNDPDALILRQPQLGTAVAVLFFAGLAGLVFFLFPELTVAPLLFTGVALWQAKGLLDVHELAIHVAGRRLTYRNGSRFTAPVFDGTYSSHASLDEADSAGLRVVLRAHGGDPGLASTKLRSRRVFVDVTLPSGLRLSAPVGFPMGPGVGVDIGQELGERFAVAFEDATSFKDAAPAETQTPTAEDPESGS